MKKQLIALSLGLVLTAPVLKAQNEADPYVREAPAASVNSGDPFGPAEPVPTVNISMTFETFSLELSQAAALMREGIEDQALYAKLLELVAKNTVKQEYFTVVRSAPGAQVSSQAISEQIYPTEYVTPEAVAPVQSKEGEDGKVQPGSAVATTASVVPASATTRNTGMLIQAEGMLNEDRETVSIRAVPEIVIPAGRGVWGQGSSRTEYPEFETQKLETNFHVRLNKPFLIGTMNRVPQSKVDTDAAHRVWFTFVTAKIVKP